MCIVKDVVASKRVLLFVPIYVCLANDSNMNSNTCRATGGRTHQSLKIKALRSLETSGYI
jgi:hypothetical protein